MSQVLEDLLDVLDLERLEDNLFRGASRDLGGKSVFGGQVVSQALVAASRTLEGAAAPAPAELARCAAAPPHSLHAYFLRPGDMTLPIVYEVDRVRDGRSFSTRRVQAIQHGQPILSMMASFQRTEPGLEHQAPMPRVPPPETLTLQSELREQWVAQAPHLPERTRRGYLRQLAIEFKSVKPWNPLKPEVREPRQEIWFRAAGELPDDPLLHTCVLAYATDFKLLSTALLPHGRTWFQLDMVVASIDHALWFHRDVRIDDWLLYSMESPTAQGARGLSRGLIFDRQGRLVASVAQESLMRLTSIPPA